MKSATQNTNLFQVYNKIPGKKHFGHFSFYVAEIIEASRQACLNTRVDTSIEMQHITCLKRISILCRVLKKNSLY